MSWTASGRANLGDGTMELTYSPPVEQMADGPAAQAQIATEAVEDMLEEGYFGDEGVVSVSITGHSNPDHAHEGHAPETLSLSITRVE
jgi:hypothetical protein